MAFNSFKLKLIRVVSRIVNEKSTTQAMHFKREFTVRTRSLGTLMDINNEKRPQSHQPLNGHTLEHIFGLNSNQITTKDAACTRKYPSNHATPSEY